MNKKRKILVIEDNHDMRVCLRQILESKGYEVYSAANGKDALNIIEKGFTPSFVILDLHMPIMSGEEFLQAKKKLKKMCSVPTMIISGDLKESGHHDAEFFLPKPLDWSHLIHTVATNGLSA